MIERPQDYGAQVLMRLQNGLAIPGVTYLEAMRWRGPALAAYLAAVTGTDAVIAPVAPMPAVTIAESDVGNSPDAEAVIQRITKFTRPINYLGLPSLSIPTGFTKTGLPVGMQLIGRAFDEAGLVRIGAAFQRATDYHQQVPKARMSNLVEIRDLNIRFTGERTVHAVNDISLSLGEGEVLGLLGESGSGKSVTLRALMRLLPRKRTQISGTVKVLGRDVLAMNDEELSAFRGQTVSMIFQEPALALDPVYTIGQQIAESVMRHEGKSQKEGMARALEMLEVVRIPSAKRRLDAYPHEMSGGMRQRAMIALALACKPKILLADEPTTALDATVQIQILLLLRELQREFGMSVIFVTHDIGVAIEICDRVAVMYAGQIVEQGRLRDIVRYAGASLCQGAAGFDRPRRQARPAAGDHPGHAAVARQGARELLVRAALQFCAAALHRGIAAQRAGVGGYEPRGVCWRSRRKRLRKAGYPPSPRIGPAFDLRRSHDLFRLMRIDGARVRGPALRQNLHGEQLGVDFGFEGAGRARHALRCLVRLVRTKSHIPRVALFHADITRVT